MVVFRLFSQEVQEATRRQREGQPLREIHELLEVAGSSPDVRAAVAEAYVKGQAEAIPLLRAQRDEIKRLQPQVGGRGRKLTSQDETASLLRVLERLHQEHHERGTGEKLLKEIATELGRELGDEDLDYRTVRRRLSELSQQPSASFRFSISPATPLAAWILERN